MQENIKLVIWDLDETFWKGTLAEGGAVWVTEHENIVKTLALRGILSSICSKNKFDDAMVLIKSKGMESYFIFPSIDWSPKGVRIKAIIENAHLRDENVLFIDDNPINRAEVLFLNPKINVVSELFISDMLEHEKLKGKDDYNLSRLAQYKGLELRKISSLDADGDDVDFLRGSEIRVFIDYDLERNIDRCIELINRTNQLNFTKHRLSADINVARKEFLEIIRDPRVQGGLIHCRDKYGDHGFVGLYIISEGAVLRHFVFSCRILGMQLEKWVYNRLGRPYLAIVGEVLYDPTVESDDVDYIELFFDKDRFSDQEEYRPDINRRRNFYILGGCVMENVGHYLKVFSGDVIYEGNARRNGIDIRRTHTSFLIYGKWLENKNFLDAIEKIGCIKEDFDNKIFSSDKNSAVVLSFWYDQICILYRHQRLGIEMPFLIDGVNWSTDLTELYFDDLPSDFRNAKNAQEIFEYFKENFICEGFINPNKYAERIGLILDLIDPDLPIFILDVPSQNEIKWGERQIQPDMIEPIKRVHAEIAKIRQNIYIIDPLEFVMQPSERLDWWHFDRKVYYRIFNKIKSLTELISPT